MKKIALAHDFLVHYGGAESVLVALADIYPKAPIYTLLFDKEKTDKWLTGKKIIPSSIQKMPGFLKRRPRWLLPVLPIGTETFNFRDYDLVISSSSGFTKGVVVKPKTVHVCYLHAPMRYVWDAAHSYTEHNYLKGKRKLLSRLLLNYLRMWDRASAERVDYFIANSHYTARRIKKYYRKEAQVVYPPVATHLFTPQKEHEGYFLTIARLSPYKRVKLIVDTFKRLDMPLVVVGDGQERKLLEKLTRKNPKIKILGWVDEKEKIKLIQNSRAFVFAADDDFGIASVEAMAAGKPVIALRAGGMEEIMQEGVTGEFFNVPQLELLVDAVYRFIEKEPGYDPEKIRQRAEEFSVEKFRARWQECINEIFKTRR